MRNEGRRKKEEGGREKENAAAVIFLIPSFLVFLVFMLCLAIFKNRLISKMMSEINLCVSAALEEDRTF